MSHLTEQNYLDIMRKILRDGTVREGRNGITKSIPFPSLTWDFEYGYLPLITTRKMHTKGILGEYAAIVRGPKHIDDFRKWGCNYWEKWANDDGTITVDYGNAWTDYNGVNQVEAVLQSLRDNPGDRRMVIDAWRPDRLEDLSLPCCHYSYQFWSDGTRLSLLWNQRSADWCIGVPSDMLFAGVMLACFASLTNHKLGQLTMQFGDAHIYEEHFEGAQEQIRRNPHIPPRFRLSEQEEFNTFQPVDLQVFDYNHYDPISYELKG